CTSVQVRPLTCHASGDARDSMNPRSSRNGPTRSGAALIHRGPQALSSPHVATANYAPPMHAPNAALLIDFDNVTMGIRTDLGKELRNLLGSDIIKGKVAVQRAYADWRRYPQYIVPLAESSIDMIMAPAHVVGDRGALRPELLPVGVPRELVGLHAEPRLVELR